MRRSFWIVCLLVLSMVVLTACGGNGNMTDELNFTADVKDATEDTIQVNSAIYDVLDFEDTQEAEFAVKGLIAAPEKLELISEDGSVIWSQTAYDFVDNSDSIPDTANPSLWKNTINNHAYGLFEVTDGIYQVRGYDMSNLTLIEGDTGWIIFDPLMSVECCTAAMQLVEENLGERPIKAVIISHPHIDHFGGIKGVMTSEEAADATLSIQQQIGSGKIPIIVPEGFTEHAVAENVYAGFAMGRRAMYQYGTALDPSATGTLAMGIGMGQCLGTGSFITPTYEIKETGETYTVDGITMEFQMTPGTEAPAEMNTWFPQKNALWVAENCTGTLHNLYTLRGAQVRDGNQWAAYITEAISRYGKDVDVTFQSHNWPHWGNDVVNDYLVNTAAVYKFINDQTLTYLNQGYTSDEISNMIELPGELAKNWYTRQYYGTVAHDSKAVYQKYMGWYDANPVNLNPLEPTESAKKWVEYLGDTDEVLKKAKADFDKGEYRWVAEVTNVIVFAEPDNQAARLLCADALEQLGYQSESGTWRNAYLTGAKELREGNLANKVKTNGGSVELQTNMTASMMFDFMGILMDKKAMEDQDFTINVNLTDTKEIYMLRVKNGALLRYENMASDNPDVTITCPKNALYTIISGDKEKIEQYIQVEGDGDILYGFVDSLNQLTRGKMADFNIVEP